MSKLILSFILISFLSLSSYAQISKSNIKVGDTFIIGKAKNNNYKHIDFPKKNFIIKRGGIASYKNIIGKKVEVTSMKKNTEGNIIATIKLKANNYFFKSHKYMSVNINNAIEDKELLIN